MAGLLPEQKFMDVTPALRAYSTGAADYRSQQDYAHKMEQRNLLKQVGQTAASQGLNAAGIQAMQGGDVGTGIKLQELSLDRQAKLYDFMGRGAVAADTPEKWQAYVGTLAQTFGPESVKGFEDFRTRESAIMLAMSAKEQADLKLRQQSQNLQERQVRVAEEGLRGRPENRTVKNPDGSESIIRVNPDGTTAQVYGAPAAAPTNPYAAGGKFNETQGKAATYADRMNEAHSVITNLEDVNKGLTGYVAGGLEGTTIPKMGRVGDSGTFNSLVGEDRQKFMQAKRNFVNSILRKESGAVISPDEFNNADKQYFPQPGDSKAVIDQKRQNRITAMQGMMREAGPSYKAPEIATEPKKKTSLPKGVTKEAALADARKAIADGKDKAAIISRLKGWGVDTSGL